MTWDKAQFESAVSILAVDAEWSHNDKSSLDLKFFGVLIAKSRPSTCLISDCDLIIVHKSNGWHLEPVRI